MTKSASTQRRVEESQPEAAPEVEQETEDPFRTLRSFHEKQREERQGEDRARTSVTSHSTLEGAVGGTVTQYPKPQRHTQKNQTQRDSQYKTVKYQENNPPPQNNFYQGPADTTTYMELPNGLRNKICGRCGLMGHIKKFCKEEVYCKYCRVYTHSTTACRTYPATSSRKNTPEKRTQEDIDQEVNRRVQKDLLRILSDITTNRQVDTGNPGITYPNQGPTQVGVPNQTVSGSDPYQHIPEQINRVQELIGELQRPSEVAERGHNVNESGHQVRTNNQEHILNQQWDDRLQLQPPLRPTNVSASQVMSRPSQPNPTTEANTAIPATSRQVETTVNTRQGQHTDTPETSEPQSVSAGVTGSQPNLVTPATNRLVEGSGITQCSCRCQQSERVHNLNPPSTQKQRQNLHTDYEDRSTITSNFFREKKQPDENVQRECQIIRILPSEDDDYLDLIRNSVSSQTRGGPKPMFVNNYFVGDNWKSVPRVNADLTRHCDESKNRLSTGVQTAVSFLGEEEKGSNIIRTGLARVKSMGNSENDCNVRSPVVVEPTRQGNSTGWSTHSFNLPEAHQDGSGQQCKGFPDFTIPPPPIVTQSPQPKCSDPEESTILTVMEKMTETMAKQMKLSATQADYNMQQNTKIMDQFIRAQDRRDLDPALMDIPTFTGQEPEKCLEWITRIRNVCRQSGRSFQQELTNKSGLVVQNFLSSLEVNITDDELIEKLLQMFSDIPTTTQAIKKLKEMKQGENESILAYNQRYKTLVERVEGKPIELITSPVAMEMYLGTIIPPIAKSIKNNIFWGSRHAPSTVGEAMTKAQQLHVKHLYATGTEADEDQTKPAEEVVINEISQRFQNKYQNRRDDFRDSSRNRQDNYEQRQWQQYGGRRNANYYQSSPDTGVEDRSKQRRFDTATSTASNSQQSTDRRQDPNETSDDSTRRQSRGEANQNSVLRGGYTQILVNPMQLTDAEFTTWLEKLVEARKNRQERKPRPYRNFRKPYNNDQSEFKKPPLKNKLQPAQELDVQNIMDMFHCEYDDIVEAVDLYNMDVEESQMA